MPPDPAALCTRTALGDAELAAPRHGLAIAQRRLLALVDHPVAIDELVQRAGVAADRLERDLAKLVDAGLVRLQMPGPGASPLLARPSRPAATPGWTVPTPAQASNEASPAGVAPDGPVVIGRKVRRGRAIAAGFGALALALGGVWFFAAPAPPSSRDTAKPPATPPMRMAADAPPRREAPTATHGAGAPVSESTPRAPSAAPSAGSPSPLVAAQPLRDPPSHPASPVASGSEVPALAPRLAATRQPPAATATIPIAAEPSPRAIDAPAALPAPEPAGHASTLAPPPAPLSAPGGETAAAPAPSAMPTRLAVAPAIASEPRAAQSGLVPVTRDSPGFPREALSAGVSQGTVRARLAIDASGKVTNVEILESQPRRVFDRAVSRSLSRWTYEPGAAGRTTDVEIAFSRD